jgi:hypothetical protein
MEGARAKEVLATSVSVAELFDSGVSIVVLFLATVLAIVFGLLIVLSNATLFERLKELIRISRGHDPAVTSDRDETTETDDDRNGGDSWLRQVRRRLWRRSVAERSSVR